MIRRTLVSVAILVISLLSAAAQDRVSIGATRIVGNGPLFLAAGNGAFKAEGLDLDLKFYPTPQAIAVALGKGEIDVGVSAFSPELFKLAGRGTVRLIAGQTREKKDVEGNEIVASVPAYSRGLRALEDLPGTSLAFVQLGSPSHYQASLIARLKRFDLKAVLIKPMGSADAVAAAIAAGQADAAVLPSPQARELFAAGAARLLGWCSQFDETQLGGVFATAKIIDTRRAVLEKFVRAYQRGTADYAAALSRIDRQHKRVSDAASQAAAAVIGRILYPNGSAEKIVTLVEDSAYAVDPQAWLDINDVFEQFTWLKAQGFIDSEADVRLVVDPSFIKGHTNLSR